ncbi:MAG: hypothetical protein EHM28_11075 [Spirochaetaceae bacterium]|nr:MAG: hypothetical protein EHM28_11075 [Spirochaetaceae bacterium]
MFFLVLKKTAYFVIDHFRALLFLNAIMILSLVIAVFFPVLLIFIPLQIRFWDIPVLFFAGAAVGLAQFSVVSGAVAFLVRGLTEHKQPSLNGFFTGLKKTWKMNFAAAGLFWLAVIFILALFQFMGLLFGVLGILAASILFWLFLSILLCYQFFPSFQLRHSGKFFSLLRSLFYFHMDNTLFSLFTLGTNLLIAAASPLLLCTGIGGATMLAFTDIGLGMRLAKYDYLETHPKDAGKPVPWDKLLSEEQKQMDSRAIEEILPWLSGVGKTRNSSRGKKD